MSSLMCANENVFYRVSDTGYGYKILMLALEGCIDG